MSQKSGKAWKKTWVVPKNDFIPGVEIRYAVLDVYSGEIFTQNHKSIGEAFNSSIEDYVNNDHLIVVATQNDTIIGQVRSNGTLKRNNLKLPMTIWHGPMNIYFNPNLKVKEEVVVEEKKSLLTSIKNFLGIK